LFARLLDRANGYKLLAITFSASTLFFTVYIARSAAVPSVHGYGDIIGGGSILLLALVPIVPAYMAAKKNRTPQIETQAQQFSTALAFWSLMLIASADFVILLYQSLAATLGMNFHPSLQLYNFPDALMLIVLLAVILVKNVKEQPTYRDLFLSFVTLLVVGAILSLLKYPTGNFLTSVALPFVFGVLVVASFRSSQWILTSVRHSHLFAKSNYFVYFGVAILLLGVFVSSSMATSATETVSINQSVSTLGLKLSVLQMSTSPSPAQVYLPPYGMVPESIDTVISYSLGYEPSNVNVLVLKFYPALNQFFSTPSIRHSLLGDTYVVASATQSVRDATLLALKNRTPVVLGTSTDIKITVMEIPAVSLVWLGTAILVCASTPLILLRGADELGSHQ
jgi:hypothetical protein